SACWWRGARGARAPRRMPARMTRTARTTTMARNDGGSRTVSSVDAHVIPVGSELLGDRPDTNGPEVARRLAARGFAVAAIHVVRDDVGAARRALSGALEGRGLVVVTGGL